jgi:hypothetical protein
MTPNFLSSSKRRIQSIITIPNRPKSKFRKKEIKRERKIKTGFRRERSPNDRVKKTFNCSKGANPKAR